MELNPQDAQWAALSAEQQALVRKLIEERLLSINAVASGAQAASTVSRVARTGELPLSFAQQRLWFFDQLVAGSPVYNLPLTADLRGPLDRDTLVVALQHAVQRHEVFRTAFHSHEGLPVCTIAPEAPLDVPIVDLSTLPDDQQEAELDALILAEAAQGFDLSKPPLIRAALVIRELERHILLVNVHHIVCDGQSEALLFQEVQAIYNATVRQQPTLPPLPIQYVDFAAWQRRTTYSSDLAYWANQLAGAPATINLNTHITSSRSFSFAGRTLSIALPAALDAALRSWSEQRRLTLFTTLFAAFTTLLHQLSAQSDLVVGTLVDDRPLRETERLIGLFLNPLPIRVGCADDPSFVELAHRVQKSLWEAIEHRHVPFEQIVAHVMRAHDRSLYPIFNVMVSQDICPQLDLHNVHAELRSWDNNNQTSKYDLSLGIMEGKDGTHLNFACNVSVFDQSALDQFAENFLALLAQIPSQAGQKLSELRADLPESLAEPRDLGLAQGRVPQTQSQMVIPSPEVTSEIMAIWSEVLNVDASQIQFDTNFFELGGHSLLALQVIARVLEQFQSILPADTFEFEGRLLNALFEEPTVRTMALMVDEALAAEIDQLSEDEVREILDTSEG